MSALGGRFPRWSSLRLRTKGLVVVVLPILPLLFFCLIIAVPLFRYGAVGDARYLPPARRHAAGIVQFVILVGALGCAVTGFAAAVVVGNSMRRRLDRLIEHTNTLMQADIPDDVAFGSDEIGILADRMREAGRLLRQRDEDLRRAMARQEQMNAELARQATALQATNQELEAFSYSVSHDLRAPLRAIDGFSQVLEEEQAAQLGDDGRDALRRVRAAARRMGTLIDDLLNLSRLTRMEMQRTHVDVSAMASGIVDELRRAAPDRHVDVSIAPGLVADADPRMLRIALQNLIENAWKYTGRTAGARIEFASAPRDGESGFVIRDNGAGFDMQYAGKLFGAFQRLHSDREFEGTGIGLAIVQRIVNRHGGRVWAEGAVGAGATFGFTLGGDAARVDRLEDRDRIPA